MAIVWLTVSLQINEDESPAIRTIFEQYVNTDTGANGLSKYLETHGFQKLARQNGTSPLFSATLIRAILKNPVYCGKIAFGRRKLEKIHGTRNEYHQVPQENYLLVDGLHKGIVSEELWNAAQVKLLAQSKRYEPVNRKEDGTGAFIIRPYQVPHLRCWNVQQQMHQTKERWHTL